MSLESFMLGYVAGMATVLILLRLYDFLDQIEHPKQ